MLLSLAEIVQPAIAPMNSVIIKEDTTGQELYMIRAGEVEVTQGGRVVDPSTAKGPIRIRRA